MKQLLILLLFAILASCDVTKELHYTANEVTYYDRDGEANFNLQVEVTFKDSVMLVNDGHHLLVFKLSYKKNSRELEYSDSVTTVVVTKTGTGQIVVREIPIAGAERRYILHEKTRENK